MRGRRCPGHGRGLHATLLQRPPPPQRPPPAEPPPPAPQRRCACLKAPGTRSWACPRAFPPTSWGKRCGGLSSLAAGPASHQRAGHSLQASAQLSARLPCVRALRRAAACRALLRPPLCLLGAPPQDRNLLVQQAADTGSIDNYEGWRQSVKGRRFKVRGVRLFNVSEVTGEGTGEGGEWGRRGEGEGAWGVAGILFVGWQLCGRRRRARHYPAATAGLRGARLPADSSHSRVLARPRGAGELFGQAAVFREYEEEVRSGSSSRSSQGTRPCSDGPAPAGAPEHGMGPSCRTLPRLPARLLALVRAQSLRPPPLPWISSPWRRTAPLSQCRATRRPRRSCRRPTTSCRRRRTRLRRRQRRCGS